MGRDTLSRYFHCDVATLVSAFGALGYFRSSLSNRYLEKQKNYKQERIKSRFINLMGLRYIKMALTLSERNASLMLLVGLPSRHKTSVRRRRR